MKNMVLLVLLVGVSSSAINAGDKKEEASSRLVREARALAQSSRDSLSSLAAGVLARFKCTSGNLHDLVPDEDSLHDGTQAYHDKLTMLDLHAAFGSIEDIDEENKTVAIRLSMLGSGDMYFWGVLAAAEQEYAVRVVGCPDKGRHGVIVQGDEDTDEIICHNQRCLCRLNFQYRAKRWFKK